DSADAEATLVAEPFGIHTPLATAGHVPVEVAVYAVPLGGAAGDHGVVLGAEVALQNAHHIVRELAGVHRRLEVTVGVTSASRAERADVGRRVDGGEVRLGAEDADPGEGPLFVNRVGRIEQAASVRVAGVIGIVPAVSDAAAVGQLVAVLVVGPDAG